MTIKNKSKSISISKSKNKKKYFIAFIQNIVYASICLFVLTNNHFLANIILDFAFILFYFKAKYHERNKTNDINLIIHSFIITDYSAIIPLLNYQ